MVAASVRDSSAWWMMLDFVTEHPCKIWKKHHTSKWDKKTQHERHEEHCSLMTLSSRCSLGSSKYDSDFSIGSANKKSLMASQVMVDVFEPWTRRHRFCQNRQQETLKAVRWEPQLPWQCRNVAKSRLKLLRHVGFSNLGSLGHILRDFGTVCSRCCKPACLLSETQKAG